MANERDFIWQQQGASSFVKIKMDWARFGKIHFSFVQHSGKPACKQVASIEAALKVDGGDGALYLAEAVKNNTMERRRAKALEDQKACLPSEKVEQAPSCHAPRAVNPRNGRYCRNP